MENAGLVIPFITVTIFLLLQIITVLHVKKAGRTLSRWLITICFGIFLISMLEGLYLFTGFYIKNPSFGFIAGPLILLLGPLLYFFTLSVLDRTFRLRYTSSWHFIPFLVVLTGIQWPFQSSTTAQKISILQKSIEVDQPPAFIFISTFIFFMITGIYVVIAFLKISKMESRFKELYARFESVHFYWLRQLMIAMLIIILISFIQNIIRLELPHLWSWAILFNLVLFIIAGSILFFNFIGHEALTIPVFTQKSPTDINQLKRIADRCEVLMKEEQYYLKNDITLTKLADKLKVAAPDLSMSLNRILKKSFFDYINEKRIEEAANMLKQYSPREKNITQIMLTCGFNSKSSFNTAFRKYLKKSPREYRKAHS